MRINIMIAVVSNYDDGGDIVGHITQYYAIKNISMPDLKQPRGKNALFRETYLSKFIRSPAKSDMERKAFYLRKNIEKYGNLVVTNCSNDDDIDLIHGFDGVVIKFVSKRSINIKDSVIHDGCCDYIIDADMQYGDDLSKIMKHMGIKIQPLLDCEDIAYLSMAIIGLLYMFAVIMNEFVKYFS